MRLPAKKYATVEQKNFIKELVEKLGMTPMNEIEFTSMTTFRATQLITTYQRNWRDKMVEDWFTNSASEMGPE